MPSCFSQEESSRASSASSSSARSLDASALCVRASLCRVEVRSGSGGWTREPPIKAVSKLWSFFVKHGVRGVGGQGDLQIPLHGVSLPDRVAGVVPSSRQTSTRGVSVNRGSVLSVLSLEQFICSADVITEKVPSLREHRHS